MDCCVTESSVLGSRHYADFLKSQGKMVYELDGVFWMNHHSALIPTSAMPVYTDLSYKEAVQLVNKSGALFLRYATGPVMAPSSWWNIVCRHYDFNKVSSNTRSKIRRGLRRLDIKRVSPDKIAEQGYQCHVKCYSRYKHALPQSKKAFESFLQSLTGQSIFDIWACTKDKQLLGYILCLVENNGVFMHTIDITPAGLRDYAAYAMIHHILQFYVNEKALPVSNGSRSIAHDTHMQDFLCKLGFEKEYAELHVIYRPDIRLVVSLLYPFRKALKLLNGISFVHKVSSILFQEQIVRKQIASQLST